MSPTTPYSFVDDWIVRETTYEPEEESSHATVFSLANGYMGLRGAGEELPASIAGAKGCYVGGLYDTPTGKLTEREIVCFPDWTALELAVEGEPFDLAKGEILEYARDLEMRQGLVRRRVRWRSPGGRVLVLETERFVSLVRPHIGALRVRVRVEQACGLEARHSIDPHVNNRWADHFRTVELRGASDLICSARTFDPGYDLLVRARVAGPGEVAEGATWAASIQAQPSETYEWTRVVAVVESRFTQGDLVQFAGAELDAASAYDALLDEHAKRWEETWAASNIQIEGDPEAQLGIRFSLFHLLAAAPWHSDHVSVPARGLQGQDYYGSVFWDCEIFVFPFLASTQPRAARNSIGYRTHTLDGARRKAQRFGFKGAFFAWQSQETGDDQCDLYVFTDPRTGEPIRSYFCDEQVHISADVAYAIRQYVDATGDFTIWSNGAADVVAEIARFFVSRATWNDADHRYEIKTVLGPDEYHENVDDNAYTNWLAAEAAKTAVEALDYLRDNDPVASDRVRTRLAIDEAELDRFREFAERVYRPQPHPQTRVIEQFAGYHELKEEAIEATRSRLAHPDLHKGGPLGPFQETQNIKQADVVMLLYLLRDRFDEATKRANWEYYEPRTSHDSSLSPMAYSLVAADIGMTDWAYKYFIYTSHIDLASYGPHWNLGIHSASLGGAWLALVHGFCQLRLAAEGLEIRQWPRLPSQWRRVVVPVTWHGVPLRLTFEGGGIEVESLGDAPVPVLAPNGAHELAPRGRLGLEP